jgi:hypothetical protein
MDLASKNPPLGPNCDARHAPPDILTDTSPAFRPLFAHGLIRQRSGAGLTQNEHRQGEVSEKCPSTRPLPVSSTAL